MLSYIHKYLTILLLFSLTSCTLTFGFWRFTLPGEHRRLAEQFKQEGQYAKAISEYNLHILERLGDKNRTDDENPYFYLIYIGDLQLLEDKPKEALKTYLNAKEKSVYIEFIIDRFRQTAKWYEEREDYEEAISFLTKYRNLDELLFDADIDRLHKELVRKEQEEAESIENRNKM